MDQTIVSDTVAAPKLATAIPLAILLAVGTGGHLNGYVYSSRLVGTGIPIGLKAHSEVAVSATTADDLSQIRSTLKLSVQDLANCLNVSRQTIYDWKAGQSIKSENLEKLSSLKAAAKVISDAGLVVSPLIMARKIAGGETLLSGIASGRDGAQLAQSLVGILKSEADQRQKLAARFAGRAIIAGKPSDYGLPHLSEEE